MRSTAAIVAGLVACSSPTQAPLPPATAVPAPPALPSADAAVDSEPTLRVTVPAHGEVGVIDRGRTTTVPVAELALLFRATFVRDRATRVVVAAGPDATAAAVIDVMEQAHAEGLKRFAVARDHGPPIELPSRTGEAASIDPTRLAFVIRLQANGDARVADRVVSSADLAAKLRAVTADHEDNEVVIQLEPEVQAKNMLDIIDAVHAAGIRRWAVGRAAH